MGRSQQDLASITANVDVTVHALFVKVPLKLLGISVAPVAPVAPKTSAMAPRQIPMSFSPAISKGDWKSTGPARSLGTKRVHEHFGFHW